MSAVVLPNYSENRGVAEIGDVVLKNKSGGWGPEKFLVTKTKRNNSFVDISIIGNGKLLGYQENVPASELCPIGEAEIKVVNKR